MRTLILAALASSAALGGCDARQQTPVVALAPVAQVAPVSPSVPSVAEPALDRSLEPELHFQAPPRPAGDAGTDAPSSSPMRHVRPEPAVKDGAPATHVHNTAAPVRSDGDPRSTMATPAHEKESDDRKP